jgi:hypothetical protein
MTKKQLWHNLSREMKISEIYRLQELNLSQGQIATHYNLCRETIRDFCKRNNIVPVHAQGAQINNKNAFINGQGKNTIVRLTKKVLLDAGKSLIVCERCGYIDPFKVELSRHHKDRNRSNNDVSNLEVLCWWCHNKEHEHEKYRNSKGQYA